MRKKIDEMDNIMHDRQLHVLAVTETWHEDAECMTIKRLRCLGYNVIEAARPPPPRHVDEDINYINHGGIAIVSKLDVLVTKLNVKFKASTFEFLCCRVTLAAANTIFVTIYRPGSQPTDTTFFE